MAASPAKFWKHNTRDRKESTILGHKTKQHTNISSVSERAFPGFFGDCFDCSTPFKSGVLVHKNSLASCQRCCHSVETRTVTCPSNKLIRVLGHGWIDIPHVHTFEGDSVLSKLFATFFILPSLSLFWLNPAEPDEYDSLQPHVQAWLSWSERGTVNP